MEPLIFIHQESENALLTDFLGNLQLQNVVIPIIQRL